MSFAAIAYSRNELPARALHAGATYRLTINGTTGLDPVSDLNHARLDGIGVGLPGSDFVKTFVARISRPARTKTASHFH